MLLIEIPEAVEGRKPVNTGEDTDENQAKSYSPLEVQLKALLANLELLEGVPPRPDSEEAKASLEYKVNLIEGKLEFNTSFHWKGGQDRL